MRSRRIGSVRITARGGRRRDAAAFLLRHIGVLALGGEIGPRCLGLVADADQGGGIAGGLERVGNHQRHRLAVEQHAVVFQRPERMAGQRHRILPGRIPPGGARPVFMRVDFHDTGRCGGIGEVDRQNAAAVDGGGGNEAEQRIRGGVFDRVGAVPVTFFAPSMRGRGKPMTRPVVG